MPQCVEKAEDAELCAHTEGLELPEVCEATLFGRLEVDGSV